MKQTHWLAAPCLLAASLMASTGSAEDNPLVPLVPLVLWSHDPVIDSVDVTPDGQRLAMLTLSNVNEAPQITVRDTARLDAEPIARFAPEDSKALGVSWLSNDALLVIGRMKYDYKYGGRTTRWFRNRLYVYTIDENDQVGRPARLFDDNSQVLGGSVINRLIEQPDKVLISIATEASDRATDHYELDVKSFKTRRVHRGSPIKLAFTNYRGEVFARSEVEGGGAKGAHMRFLYKHPETGAWEHHHTLYARDREGMSPAGLDPDGRTVYVRDNTGRDKAVVRKYDLVSRSLSEPIFAPDGSEALDIIQSQHPDTYGEVIGFLHADDRVRRTYVSPRWNTLYDRVAQALPEDQVPVIESVSDDFNQIVVRASGDKEPGAWYLLSNQKAMSPLGRSYPGINPAEMSDMTFVEYEARDGLVIPGYLTLPRRGEAPWPAVVMPHGGPWARDYWGWDPWVQFLANRGYAVLQPNYRGSEGFGQKLWRAGDREWGQKMQDDKDDGAAWLVREGIADPDRIAIFGYSYGGYAAMAAVVRPNSPYQCAVAGAGLAELRTFDKVTFEGDFIRDYQNPTVAGLSPLDEVKKANIPIYIFHGDRDQRVPVEQSRKYYRALKRAGATVEYNEVPDLWHSYPWFPTHRMGLYELLEDYLGNRCGPGGL